MEAIRRHKILKLTYLNILSFNFVSNMPRSGYYDHREIHFAHTIFIELKYLWRVSVYMFWINLNTTTRSDFRVSTKTPTSIPYSMSRKKLWCCISLQVLMIKAWSKKLSFYKRIYTNRHYYCVLLMKVAPDTWLCIKF